VPPVPHLDVCGIINDTVKVVNAIGNVSDKTTVHDNALMGCRADGCHCHRTGFLPLVELGTGHSNAQLCESSVDGHRHRLLGLIPCDTEVEETVHINVRQTLDGNGTHCVQSEVNFSIGAAGFGTGALSRYQRLNRKRRDQK